MEHSFFLKLDMTFHEIPFVLLSSLIFLSKLSHSHFFLCLQVDLFSNPVGLHRSLRSLIAFIGTTGTKGAAEGSIVQILQQLGELLAHFVVRWISLNHKLQKFTALFYWWNCVSEAFQEERLWKTKARNKWTNHELIMNKSWLKNLSSPSC